MKQITVNIPDHQFGFFMNLIENLNFVQIAEPSKLEKSLSKEQQEIWKNIRMVSMKWKWQKKEKLNLVQLVTC
jgi:hypothetical protein